MNKDLLAVQLRRSIQKYGDRTAMQSKDPETAQWHNISWREFGNRLEALSKALLELDVKESEMVGIFSQNMPEWSIADYAIQSVRATSVPIYPTSTVDQAIYILNEAEVGILFVGEQEQYDKACALFQSCKTLRKIVVFDPRVNLRETVPSQHFSDLLAQGRKSSREKEVTERLERAQPDDLSTLIYTSGTTGDPKGVMLDNQNFMQAMKIHSQRLPLSDSDVSMAFLPLSHVFERGWTYYAFYSGLTIAYLRNPKDVVEAIREVRPAYMCAVPRFYEKVYAAIYEKVESASAKKQKLFNWAVKTGQRHLQYKRLGQRVPTRLWLRYRLADRLVLSKLRKALGGRVKFLPAAGAPLSEQIIEFFHSIGVFIRYGYGLTETTATVSAFEDRYFKFGTVGKVFPEVEVKIGDQNEILVRGKTVMRGYYKKPAATAKVFQDGWLRTGDAGNVDSEGHITLTERIKDLMKTSGGKYVAPQKLESILGCDRFIEQIAVVGDRRQYVTALAVPSFDALKDLAQKMNIKFHDIEDLVRHSHIIDFFEKRFEAMQQQLPNFEKVKKFRLLPREFSLDKGEITATLKIKREAIIRKYKHLIDSMYSDKDDKKEQS